MVENICQVYFESRRDDLMIGLLNGRPYRALKWLLDNLATISSPRRGFLLNVFYLEPTAVFCN